MRKVLRLYKYQIIKIRSNAYYFDLKRSLDTGAIKILSNEKLLLICKDSFVRMKINKEIESAEINGSELIVKLK